jgi:hypothetical protein
MKKRTKVSLMVVAGLMGVGFWYFLTEDHGVGVDSVGWLPPEAHNITYLRNSLNMMAEFDIEREAFEKWCARRKMPLRELGTEGYHAILRCLAWLEDRGVMPPITEPNEGEADLRRAQRAVKVFGAGDLFYEDRWSNGGGYWIGYDTKEKRGYYRFAHH